MSTCGTEAGRAVRYGGVGGGVDDSAGEGDRLSAIQCHLPEGISELFNVADCTCRYTIILHVGREIIQVM